MEEKKRKKILANRVYSDSTLKGWKKEDLIEQIRILEHNWAAAEEALNNSSKTPRNYLPSKRLKTEFKTDYRNSWRNKFFRLMEENAKLQKYVELLKDRLAKTTEAIDTALYVTDTCQKKVEQAVKDTAKEIFDSIFEVLCVFATKGKSKEYNEGFLEAVSEIDERLQKLAKEKGVEVE